MKSNISGERLGTLLDATILSYLETMSLVEDTAVFDEMFNHLLKGDLDSVFISPKLNQIPFKERENAFDIARRHAGVCFYKGNPEYWTESVLGYRPNDPLELISEHGTFYAWGETKPQTDNAYSWESYKWKGEKIYKGLTPEQKRVLYTYPKGVLFSEDEILDPSSDMLLSKLSEYSYDDNVSRMNTIAEVANYLGNDLFNSVIRDIHLDTNKSFHN